ncbi:MAG: ATP synthase F1 subunit gamma [Deltaproteobacteria bacterium]|nr:MAG: ATP synthase F1 subunit gamma [Deltaproteobacteria bacterium]
MAGSLKAIRKRITSVRNTQQVTKAMKMVSAAKLRRAQERAETARAYDEKLSEVLARVLAGVRGIDHPLLRGGGEGPPHVVLVTADRGLCGGYNANLVRLAEQFLASPEGSGATLTVCGRRGRDYFRRRGAKIVSEHVNLGREFDLALAREIVGDVLGRFERGEAGSIHIVYSQFRSALSQQPRIDRLLPVEAPAAEDEQAALREYLFEPSPAELLASLLPRYVETRVYRALLEASASEHGARMTAMDNATRNASEMIDRLTLAMNRARQAGITTELMEIVGGAEALKG